MEILPSVPTLGKVVLVFCYLGPGYEEGGNLLLNSESLHHTVFCHSPQAPAVLSSVSCGLVCAIEDGIYTGLREAHEREAAAKA